MKHSVLHKFHFHRFLRGSISFSTVNIVWKKNVWQTNKIYETFCSVQIPFSVANAKIKMIKKLLKQFYTNFMIIALTSSITSHALCPPITSSFISPSFHSCIPDFMPQKKKKLILLTKMVKVIYSIIVLNFELTWIVGIFWGLKRCNKEMSMKDMN